LDSRLSILFATAEVEGFAKTGGLADVAKSLPLGLSKLGHDVRICMPCYKDLAHQDQSEWVADLEIPEPQRQRWIRFSVRKLDLSSVTVYLIDCPLFFYRDGLYNDGHRAYPDNGYRFLFFSLACLVTARAMGFRPDIIHCNDWHTAVIPYLLRHHFSNEPIFQNTRTVLTIHNAAYQGVFEKSQLWLVPTLAGCNIDRILENDRCLNFLKCGVAFADKINAVSPTYALELLTPLGSHGMSRVFRDRAEDLCGILNGTNYQDWDPASDPYLDTNYDMHNMAGKFRCKQALQRQLGLAELPVPIFSMICRLTEQKGFHILLPALQQLLRHRVQVVLMGTGDPQIVAELQWLAVRNPEKLHFINAYSEAQAHQIEAGADFFIMPSLFEPCGLNQMYSPAYGTLPIVRNVGGLKDTVVDFDRDPQRATGFSFSEPTVMHLLNILRRALLLYLEHPEEIAQLRLRAMQTRFDWGKSSQQYEQLYRRALTRPRIC